jgi:lysophospholipase L1-like esterase
MKNTVNNKHFLLLWGFIIMSISVFAWRPTSKDTINPYSYQPIDSTYKFIKYASNHIYQEDQTVLGTFFAQLDSLRLGLVKKVSIVHLGDSHIQADLFTDKIRSNFQQDASLGNGGYGLAYPHALAKTNNPSWFTSSYTGKWESCRMNNPKTTCDWGIGAMNATTTDEKASFSINLGAFKSRSYAFNTIKIYSNTLDSSSFTILFNKDDTTSMPLVQSIVIDTIQQVTTYTLSKPISKLTCSFATKNIHQTHFTLKGISLENTLQNGIIYHSIGLNSATATTFMRNDNFIKQTNSLKPSLVVISLGTNDAYGKNFNQASFLENFTRLITKIKTANPKASIILTSPADSYRKRRYPNINFTITPKLLKALAKEHHCGFWNLQYIMGGYKSINKWHQRKLCQDDKLHFKRKGYELQADLFFDALMKSYSNFK